ncbi:MAG: helix-turn-helix domain-containing protein [Alphaproteobacteria bacterium]|nr:helix-turn-helix domain-containing protein [Alphaproteobacteria bacterium]
MGSENIARDYSNHQSDEIIESVFCEVGRILAHVRKEQHLSIKQVASKIHIRQQYLKDLEEGRLSDLPGRVYILGFIRTYARFLTLDEEELIRRLNTLPSLPDYERSQVPIPMPSEEEPNAIILAASAALIVIVATMGYLFLRPSSKPLPPAVEASASDQNVSPIQAPSPIQGTRNKIVIPPLEKEPENKPVELASTPVLPVQSPPKLAPPKEAPEISSKLLINQEEKSKNSPLAQNTPNKKIILKAREPSWVEVRDKDGHVYFMKVLKQGEEYVVPNKPGVIVNTGNAGGIDFFVGDTKLPPLGKHGDVKRDIQLETLQ